MKAIGYLIIMQMKNRILALKRQPAKMIGYIIFTLTIIGLIVLSIVVPRDSEDIKLADPRIIHLALVALGLFFLTIYVGSGLSTGSTLFSMSDVGFLFTAPISSKKILLYGLLSTFGRSLLSSVFIIYQVFNLRFNFGFGSSEIIALLVAYTVMVLIGQLLSIAIYLFTNGKPQRKRLVKTLMIIGGIGLAIVLYITYIQEARSIKNALYSVADSGWIGYIPFGGWALMLFKGLLEGHVLNIVLSTVFFLGTGLAVILTLASGKADYYEDVLVSTEYIFKTQLAMKEKKTTVHAVANEKNRKRVKEGQRLKGTGVKAIIQRQLLELRRRNRIPFINGYTIMASLIAAVVGAKAGGSTGAAFGMFGFLVYMQYFLTLFNPLSTEIKSPYIFMIPEPARKKVLAASLVSFIKPCVDALIIFTVFAVAGGTDPLSALLLAIGYAAAGSIFIGLAIINQRIIEGQPNIFLKAILGILVLVFIIVPAVVFVVLTSMILDEQYVFISMIPFSLYCFLVTGLIFLLAGDVLDKMELK